MVTFTRIPYAQPRRARIQDGIVYAALICALILITGLSMVLVRSVVR